MHYLNFSEEEIGGIPWDWKIPPVLLKWNLEDWYVSIEHHYGVRCTDFDKIQGAYPTRDWRMDVLLSRRLREVLKVLNKTKGTMELSDDGRKACVFFFLLRHLNVH